MSERRTVNASFYCEVLDSVAEAMREKWPQRRPEDVLFIQDNARPHTAKLTKSKLRNLKWEVLKHPPCSPDMSPSDFHLFRSMQNHLAGVKFNSEEVLREWMTNFFYDKPASFFVRGITKLAYQWEGVMEFEGDYAVE
jgi:histone-lysine N-methyltransferase SETMAR